MYSEGRVDRICRWADIGVRDGEELGCWCKELKEELPFTKWGQPGARGDKEVPLGVLHLQWARTLRLPWSSDGGLGGIESQESSHVRGTSCHEPA